MLSQKWHSPVCTPPNIPIYTTSTIFHSAKSIIHQLSYTFMLFFILFLFLNNCFWKTLLCYYFPTMPCIYFLSWNACICSLWCSKNWFIFFVYIETFIILFFIYSGWIVSMFIFALDKKNIEKEWNCFNEFVLTSSWLQSIKLSH